MDQAIQEMMEDKSMSFKFLLAVQQHRYEEGYQIGKEILKINPLDKSVNRFMLFLQQNMGYQDEEDEEAEFECEDEEAEEEDVENDEEEEEEEEEEEYEEYEGEQQVEEDEDSEYEWVYENDAQEDGFDEGENLDEDKNFVQDDTNEGDISVSIDKKIQEKKQTQQQTQQLQQQSTKRVVQQVKPKSSIPNGIPTLPKIQNKSRPNSQSKQQIQKPQPLQQNLIKQAAVNQLRFPSSLAKKK